MLFLFILLIIWFTLLFLYVIKLINQLDSVLYIIYNNLDVDKDFWGVNNDIRS